MTDIYLHIVARMADYMATHPYSASKSSHSGQAGRGRGGRRIRRSSVRYQAVRALIPTQRGAPGQGHQSARVRVRV